MTQENSVFEAFNEGFTSDGDGFSDGGGGMIENAENGPAYSGSGLSDSEDRFAESGYDVSGSDGGITEDSVVPPGGMGDFPETGKRFSRVGENYYSVDGAGAAGETGRAETEVPTAGGPGTAETPVSVFETDEAGAAERLGDTVFVPGSDEDPGEAFSAADGYTGAGRAIFTPDGNGGNLWNHAAGTMGIYPDGKAAVISASHPTDEKGGVSGLYAGETAGNRNGERDGGFGAWFDFFTRHPELSGRELPDEMLLDVLSGLTPEEAYLPRGNGGWERTRQDGITYSQDPWRTQPRPFGTERDYSGAKENGVITDSYDAGQERRYTGLSGSAVGEQRRQYDGAVNSRGGITRNGTEPGPFYRGPVSAGSLSANKYARGRDYFDEGWSEGV